jgi:hypothetical protein
MVTRIVVHHHLGLGDHFICNGLVRHLAEQHGHIFLACKRASFATVACLYEDEPTIEPFPIDREPDDVEAFARRVGAPLVRIGFDACDRSRFDQSFYEQMGVPFAFRWSKFRLPASISGEDEMYERLAPASPYRVVHRETSHGVYALRFDHTMPAIELRGRRVDGGAFENLLLYRRLIERATEVHCINSSVIHLVDSLDAPARLVFHDARPRAFQLRRAWETVSYRARPLRKLLATLGVFSGGGTRR